MAAAKPKPDIPAAFPGALNDAEIEQAGKSTELEQSQIFTHDDLAEIETFADAMALAVRQFGGVINAHEDKNLGTGFRLTDDEDKFRLVGVPMLLLDWNFNPGDFGDDYISIRVLTQDEAGKANKFVLNDGGSGICRDLREYTRKTNRKGGLFVRRGLRVSEYATIADKNHPDNGKPAPRSYIGPTGKGKTFYLDFSG